MNPKPPVSRPLERVGGVAGFDGAGVRERFQAVEDVEELRAEADAGAIVDRERLAQAHGFRGTALAAEIVVVGGGGSEDAGGLVHPGGRVQNGFLRRIDAAAVRILEEERLAGNAELPGRLAGEIGADAVVGSGGAEQLAAGVLQDGADGPAGEHGAGEAVAAR